MTSSTEGKASFFRQSGWMVTATVIGGFFMAAVQFLANIKMDQSEYGVFISLLRFFLILTIPAGGLQTVFAQQAAAVVTPEESRRLNYTLRQVLKSIFFIWLGMVLITYWLQNPIISLLKINNPAGLWMTLCLALGSLCIPVIRGVLQGEQKFFGLGWVLILDGVGRCAAVIVIVFLLQGQAAGGLTGAVLGVTVALILGGWLIRDTLWGPTEKYRWQPWLRRIVPLTLGTGALVILQNVDVLYVQSVFSGGPNSPAEHYMPAALIGWALVQFTVPMVAVMFPKVVRSKVRSGKTDALRLTLVSTTVLGGIAACACTLFPNLPLQILFHFSPQYWVAAPLVPWLTWSLLPLTLVNVLVNNLLARDRFECVPWLLLLAAGYFAALATYGHSYLMIVKILGSFNVLALILALWFTQRDLKAHPQQPDPGNAGQAG